MKIGVQLVDKNHNLDGFTLRFVRTDWYKLAPEYTTWEEDHPGEDIPVDAFADAEVGDPEASVYRNAGAGVFEVHIDDEDTADQFTVGRHYAMTISPKTLLFANDTGF